MKWIKCSDNEPDLNTKYILVRFKPHNSNFFEYDIYVDCPYNWSYLVKVNAEFTTLRIS